MYTHKLSKFRSKSRSPKRSASLKKLRSPKRSASLKKSRSPRKMSLTKKALCQRLVSEKVAINMKEFESGKYVSKPQAIAVSYSQVNTKYPHCKKSLTKNKK